VPARLGRGSRDQGRWIEGPTFVEAARRRQFATEYTTVSGDGDKDHDRKIGVRECAMAGVVGRSVGIWSALKRMGLACGEADVYVTGRRFSGHRRSVGLVVRVLRAFAREK
jgi:hypothetical protein